MIGIVIVAHGGLAVSLLEAMEHVVGKQSNARAVAIQPTDDLHGKQSEIDQKVGEVNTGDGVVVVTDMFGGTPSNLALGAITSEDVEVVYGANLPLLVKLAKCRDRALRDAVTASLEAGHKYINSAANILDLESGKKAG
ncbi:MAG: PTS sugar transporter subunit IIA [Pseudomonadota bacterium]